MDALKRSIGETTSKKVPTKKAEPAKKNETATRPKRKVAKG
jgi:hypothetical protein